MSKKWLISGLFLSHTVLAGSLSAPMTIPSTTVLPQNISSINYLGVYTRADKRYDETGNLENIGDSFKTEITFQDLIDAEDPADQADAEALLAANNYTAEQEIGNTTGYASIAITGQTPVYARGLTKKWTVAAAFPIVTSAINIDTGAISNSTLQQAADILGSPGNAQQAKTEEIKTKYINAVEDKIERYGYDKLEDSNNTELGDIKLISKYELLKNKKNAIVLENTISLPTARKKDFNKVIDLTAGDGQTDLGIGIVSSTVLNSSANLILKGAYTVQLADTLAYRIPEKSGSSLSPDVDLNTERDLGDILSTQAVLVNKMNKEISLSAGYSFQRKSEDKYSGSAYSSERYSYLSEDTNQTMHSIQAGISISTVSLYRAKKFFAPMMAQFNFSKPIAGKNIVEDPILTFSASIFF